MRSLFGENPDPEVDFWIFPPSFRLPIKLRPTFLFSTGECRHHGPGREQLSVFIWRCVKRKFPPRCTSSRTVRTVLDSALGDPALSPMASSAHKLAPRARPAYGESRDKNRIPVAKPHSAILFGWLVGAMV